MTRRDEGRIEREQFDRLKAELTRAFAATDSAYQPLDAQAIIDRNNGGRSMR